jgi:hypothetical protein
MVVTEERVITRSDTELRVPQLPTLPDTFACDNIDCKTLIADQGVGCG